LRYEAMTGLSGEQLTELVARVHAARPRRWVHLSWPPRCPGLVRVDSAGRVFDAHERDPGLRRCDLRYQQGTRVLDPFHVVKLGLSCLDEVRRQLQQYATGHRGRTGDPLYGIRRVLRQRRDRLSVEARAPLETGLIVGDPTGETTLAWTVAQDLMGLYQLPDSARLVEADIKKIVDNNAK